jgi:hypothetical protein
MTWTPQNLTDPKFVQTQLTPLDRGNALLTMTQNLTRVQSKLAENEASLEQVQNQTNSTYSFGTVRAAKRAADQAKLAGDPNAAALLSTFEELQSKRSELLAQEDKLLTNISSGALAVQSSEVAINNLKEAGAVPPGTNQFTPPPGYTSTINPPQQVPTNQNPPDISTTSETVQNPTATSVNPNSDPNTNIGAGVQNQNTEIPINDPTGVLAAEDAALAEQAAAEGDVTAFRSNEAVADPYGVLAAEDAEIAREQANISDAELFADNERNNRPIADPTGVLAAEDAALAAQAAEEGDAAVFRSNEAIADPYGVLAAEDAALAADAAAAGDVKAFNQNAPKGISTALNDTRSKATKQDTANFQQKPDWRARLSLAPNSNYLYNVPKGQAGILAPLQGTDGVIFPYTPAISVTYSAGYDPSDLVHSNYKVYQYKGSSVDTVSITADFTAQDTTEANYLLAVIHFFRSVTKMFYGQDQNPNNGVPPPLCYLSGFGAYTFDAHPLVVTNFTYATPTEVDYIRAGSQTNQPGVNVAQQNNIVNSFVPSVVRTSMSGLAPKLPNFSTQNSLINSEATYVPTKLQLQITCIPIVTRNDISNKFSLKEYATGALLRGSKRSGGGIW